MTKRSKVKFALGGFAWLDGTAKLRRWFAQWLCTHWRLIYRDSIRALHTATDFTRLDQFEQGISRMHRRLAKLPTGEQLESVQRLASRLGFVTSHEIIEDDLRRFLTRPECRIENAAAFKASPWCNHFAVREDVHKSLGRHIPARLYPRNQDAQLALATIISEFGSAEIIRHPDEVNSLQARRVQQRLHFAVKRLCKRKDGPAKLARFVQEMLAQWPLFFAGCSVDLEEHFSPDRRSNLVRNYLALRPGETSKEARALWIVLHSMIFREELRRAVLCLAGAARDQSQQRRKGWDRLRNALRAVFAHIRREVSNEEKFRRFERANVHQMRNLTREQRMRLLPNLGNDPDNSVRDLTKKERMEAYLLYGELSRGPLHRDADGKNSFATGYGRAMKAIKSELRKPGPS